MFLLSPLFQPLMGMAPSTIHSIMSIRWRKAGVVLDAAVTNPDMARNFDDYDIENLQTPVLVLHAKDDKLANYEDTKAAITRFPENNCTFVSFEDGGHLMSGHEGEVRKAVLDFIQ